MYCPKCGSEENGRFCRKCGARLQEPKRTEEEQEIVELSGIAGEAGIVRPPEMKEEQESAEEQGIQREKHRKKMLIYTGLGLMILLMILGLLFFAGKVIQSSFAKREVECREMEIAKEEEAAETEAKTNKEFMAKYSLSVGVNWNQLSMRECPEGYIRQSLCGCGQA